MQAGCALVLTGRREAPLQETAGLIAAAGGLPALVAPADLTDAAAVEGLFAACEREHGRLDILFNNAGTPTRGLRRSRRSRSRRAAEPNRHLPYPGTFTPGVPFEELSLEQWSQV